uniref:Uncharacterized protein n=1 Tax=Vitis vinifera TaxID=29760 RepID=A5C0H5_VITVI|nr:hypothetical protein VITISV_010550 [Vitis vinifera]
MNPYGFLVVKQESKCGESSSPRDCEECLWSWFPRLMGTLSRAEGGKNKGGSGRIRSSGSQESNASNRVRFGAEMRKIWPSEDNCSRLVRNFRTTPCVVRVLCEIRTTPSKFAQPMRDHLLVEDRSGDIETMKSYCPSAVHGTSKGPVSDVNNPSSEVTESIKLNKSTFLCHPQLNASGWDQTTAQPSQYTTPTFRGMKFMQEDEKTQSGEDSEDEADDSDKIQPFQVALRGDSDTTEMMAQFSYGSTNRERADYLNSVSFFGTNFQEISLYCGQKTFEGKDETSSSNQVKIEDENREAQLPNTNAGNRITRGKNAYAISVLRREQVDYLHKRPISMKSGRPGFELLRLATIAKNAGLYFTEQALFVYFTNMVLPASYSQEATSDEKFAMAAEPFEKPLILSRVGNNKDEVFGRGGVQFLYSMWTKGSPRKSIVNIVLASFSQSPDVQWLDKAYGLWIASSCIYCFEEIG